MTLQDLNRILGEHAQWLRDEGGTRADLTGADLTGARLAGADLTGADLTGARLAGADLTGADLTGARLAGAKEDVRRILASAPHEVPAVLAALREGRVDGSTYSGSCACLVGTIANARPGAKLKEVQEQLHANPNRPAEMLFAAIREGDTPATNPVSALATQWVEEWLKEQVPAPSESP